MVSLYQPVNNWNLSDVKDFLSSASLSRWQEGVNSTLHCLSPDPGPEKLEEALQHLLELDDQINFGWSALTLNRLQPFEADLASTLSAWLSKTSQTLLDHMECLSQRLLRYSERTSNVSLKWAQSFQAEKSFEAIGLKYRSAVNLDNTIEQRSWTLLNRFMVDPDRRAYHHRLSQNDLSAAEVDFSVQHSSQSQSYFSQLLLEMDIISAPISDVRMFEAQKWAMPIFNWAEAIECLMHACEAIDPICKMTLTNALGRGHIKLTEDQSQPDLCLNTPFGSFIQLYFDGSLHTVVRLAHELGHAIHQGLFREADNGALAPTELENETWAIAFEFQLLKHMKERYPSWAEQLNAYQHAQWIEMNHRHRMLTQFEQALHDPAICCPKDVNDLWIKINHIFFGPGIMFDCHFESAWQEVHHLWSSPFYLSVYPPAIERAAQCDLREMVQSLHYQKDIT